MKFTDVIMDQPKPWIFVEAISVTVLIGWLDYLTAWELSLFIFYAVPIFLVTWCGDRRVGVLFALFSGAVWFVANAGDNPYVTTQGYVWATVNRVIYFIFVAVGGTAMRLQREEGRARLEAMTRTRELEQEIVRASEREQMRIGQDLHDGLCQNLAAIDCATECLKTELESSSPRQARTASLVQKMLKEALVEARSLARGIFPVHMDEEGLAAALEALVASTNQLRNVSIQYETKGDIRIADPTAAMHLYRIGQEAVSNAVRHAEAAHIRVNLARDGRVLVMTVADDGRGFTTENISTEGMGLRTMKYRAHLIGALLAVAPIPGGGTLVRCTLPLSHGPAN